MRTYYRFLSIALGVVLILSACDRNNLTPLDPQKRAFLQVVNLYPGAPSMDVFFDLYESSTKITGDLEFLESWPSVGYASLLTRAQDTLESDVLLRVVNSTSQDEIIPTESLKLIPEQRTTFCIVDSFGKPILVRTLDLLGTLSETQVRVRFMNLSAGTLSASLVARDESIEINGLNFLNYSSFRDMQPGSYDFDIVDDFTGEVIYTLSGVNLLAGKAYSFLLVNDDTGAVGTYYLLE